MADNVVVMTADGMHAGSSQYPPYITSNCGWQKLVTTHFSSHWMMKRRVSLDSCIHDTWSAIGFSV